VVPPSLKSFSCRQEFCWEFCRGAKKAAGTFGAPFFPPPDPQPGGGGPPWRGFFLNLGCVVGRLRGTSPNQIPSPDNLAPASCFLPPSHGPPVCPAPQHGNRVRPGPPRGGGTELARPRAPPPPPPLPRFSNCDRKPAGWWVKMPGVLSGARRPPPPRHPRWFFGAHDQKKTGCPRPSWLNGPPGQKVVPGPPWFS